MVEYLDNGDVAVFDGFTFRKDKRTGYFLSSKNIRDGKRCRLHVYVWEKANGKRVPESCEVHHVDCNKNNNEPENLVCMTAEEHREYHVAHISEDLKKKWAKNLIEKAVPASKAWHRSENGRKWHAETAKKSYEKRRLAKYICSYCGKEFETKHIYSETSNRFCSNNCKSAFRRKIGIDDTDFVCQKCGKIFRTNKYTKRKYCGDCRAESKK